MNLEEILRWLPPLCPQLGRVSRNFYRSTRRVLQDPVYWRRRYDAPRQLLHSANAYRIYHNLMDNYQSYDQHYDIAAYTPQAWEEAFPVAVDNLPHEARWSAPSDYGPSVSGIRNSKEIRQIFALRVIDWILRFIKLGMPAADIEVLAKSAYPWMAEESAGDYYLTQLGKIEQHLIKTRDSELYEVIRKYLPGSIGGYVSQNLTHRGDDVVAYREWVRQRRGPLRNFEYTDKISYLTKGVSFKSDEIRNILLSIPVRNSNRHERSRVNYLYNYLREAPVDEGLANLEDWGLLDGSEAYRTLEVVIEVKNLNLAKAIIDRLPTVKPKGYSTSQVGHIRRIIDLAVTTEGLKDYLPLTRQVDMWKKR